MGKGGTRVWHLAVEKNWGGGNCCQSFFIQKDRCWGHLSQGQNVSLIKKEKELNLHLLGMRPRDRHVDRSHGAAETKRGQILISRGWERRVKVCGDLSTAGNDCQRKAGFQIRGGRCWTVNAEKALSKTSRFCAVKGGPHRSKYTSILARRRRNGAIDIARSKNTMLQGRAS